MVMKSKTLKVHNTNRVWKRMVAISVFCPEVLFRDIMCKTPRTLCDYDKNVLSSLDSLYSESCSC